MFHRYIDSLNINHCFLIPEIKNMKNLHLFTAADDCTALISYSCFYFFFKVTLFRVGFFLSVAYLTVATFARLGPPVQY